MTTATRPSREIDGNGRTVRDADLPYAEQREHYVGQNLLARSPHERAYDHNRGFKRFIGASGLPFSAHAEFLKVDLDARQVLYQRLAERIWSPERLEREAAA